jgi:hypothetical protein
VTPIRSSGPIRIKALKRKKNGSVKKSPISCWPVTKPWIESQIAVVLSTQLVEPPGTRSRTIQTTVSSTKTKTTSRHQKRQNETRLRATTSSSLSVGSSVP